MQSIRLLTLYPNNILDSCDGCYGTAALRSSASSRTRLDYPRLGFYFCLVLVLLVQPLSYIHSYRDPRFHFMYIRCCSRQLQPPALPHPRDRAGPGPQAQPTPGTLRQRRRRARPAPNPLTRPAPKGEDNLQTPDPATNPNHDDRDGVTDLRIETHMTAAPLRLRGGAPPRTRHPQGKLIIAALNIKGAGSNGTHNAKWTEIDHTMKQKKIGLMVILESLSTDDQIKTLNKKWPKLRCFRHTHDPQNARSKGSCGHKLGHSVRSMTSVRALR